MSKTNKNIYKTRSKSITKYQTNDKPSGRKYDCLFEAMSALKFQLALLIKLKLDAWKSTALSATELASWFQSTCKYCNIVDLKNLVNVTLT